MAVFRALGRWRARRRLSSRSARFLGSDPDIALGLSLLKRAREVLTGVPCLLVWQALETRRYGAPRRDEKEVATPERLAAHATPRASAQLIQLQRIANRFDDSGRRKAGPLVHRLRLVLIDEAIGHDLRTDL